MLVLSRKLNQDIVLDDDIRITVLKIKGNTVRLGISAPNSVRIVRGELVAEPSGAQGASPQQSGEHVEPSRRSRATVEFRGSKDVAVNGESFCVISPPPLRGSAEEQAPTPTVFQAGE